MLKSLSTNQEQSKNGCSEPKRKKSLTKYDRNIITFLSENKTDFDSFYHFFIENKVFNVSFLGTKIKHHYYNELVKFYFSLFPTYEWAKSFSEHVYCYKHNIDEEPETDYVNIKLGYKNKSRNDIVIDFSKDPLDVINQLKEKYSDKWERALESKDFYHSLDGDSLPEKIYLLSNHKPKCPICEKDTKWKAGHGYTNYCSIQCANVGDAKNKTKSFQDNFFKNKLINWLDSKNLSLLSNYKSMRDVHLLKCNKCKFEFKNNFLNDTRCIKCEPYLSGTSSAELEILNFVKSLIDKDVINKYRINNKEIDIYIPELQIGIEYNGIYWHSSKFKEHNYHLMKTELSEEHGIQLIHIYSDVWENKKEIIKSILKSKLNTQSNKIYARNCEVRHANSKESNKFLEENHIQGKDNAGIRYGLYHNDILVALMTFKRSHRSKGRYMELKRFTSLLNLTVVGGFSKLLKYASDELKEDIVTFADRSFTSLNNVYTKNGFELVGTIKPNYKYLVNGILESREKFQKHKLNEILSEFDSELSEKENMNRNGFYEVYDSGNFKYIYKNIKI